MDIFDGYDINYLANQLLVNNDNFNELGDVFSPSTINGGELGDFQLIVNDAINQDLFLNDNNNLPEGVEAVNVAIVYDEDLINSFNDDTLVIVYESGGIEGLLNEFARRGLENITSLSIIDHGGNAAFQLGGEVYNRSNLKQAEQSWAELGEYLYNDYAELNLYGCSVTYDNRGVAFIDELANYINIDILEVNSSIDMTGKFDDWTLEVHTVFEQGEDVQFRIYDEDLDIYTIGRDYNQSTKLFDFYQKIKIDYSQEETNTYEFSVGYQVDPRFRGTTYNNYDIRIENIAGIDNDAQWRVTQVIEGNVGTWNFSYQTDESSASFGQLLTEENHLTGQWQVYTYTDIGLLSQVISSYQGSSIDDIGDLDLHRITSISREYLSDAQGNIDGLEETISFAIAGIDFTQETLRVEENIVTISNEEIVMRRYDFVSSLENGVDWLNYQRVDHSDGTTSIFSREDSENGIYSQRETRGLWLESTKSITRGTDIIRTYDGTGLLQTVETLDIATGYAIGNQKVAHHYNDDNLVERIEFSDGTFESFYYVNGRLDTYTQRDGEIVSYQYDNKGRLSTQTVGNQTNYTSYDGLGRVISQGLTNVSGEQLLENLYRYSADDELSIVRDALGNEQSIERFVNEEMGYYTEVIEQSDGGQIIRSYYSDGLLQQLTGSAIALEETYSYSIVVENGESFIVQRIDYADGTTTEITTDENANILKTVRYTQSSEKTVSNEYDQYNRLISSTTATGLTNYYSYDYLGRITQKAVDINDNGVIDLTIDRIVEYDYSLEKRSDNSIFSVTSTFSYLEDNSAIRSLISKQAIELFSLDAVWTSEIYNQDDVLVSQRVQEFIVGGYTINEISVDSSSEKSYYQNGQLNTREIYSSIAELVNTINYDYDDFGRFIGLSDSQGYTEEFILNDHSDIIFTTKSDADGNEIREYNFYDFSARLIESYDSLGNSSLYKYNQVGQIIEVLGTAQYRQIYDYENDKLISRTTYNSAGVSLTAYSYDGDDITQREYANDTILRYEYNNLGQLVEFVNANGISTYYQYNILGQLIEEDYSDDTVGIQWTYNRQGEISSITDASGTRTYNREGDVQYTTGLLAGTSIDQHYNTLGQFSGYDLTVGENFISKFSLSYSNDSIVYNLAGEELTLSFDGHSRNLSHDNFDINYDYTSLGLLAEITVNEISQVRYEYDNNGRITEKIDHANNLSWLYVYDSKGQLISSTYTDATGEEHSESFSYDELGNRIAESDEALAVKEYSQELNALFTDANYRNFALKRYYIQDIILKGTDYSSNFTWEQSQSADNIANLLSFVQGNLFLRRMRNNLLLMPKNY